MTHPTPLPAVELDAIGYSKRILALVDDYTDKPNKDTRAAIRAQLLSDFDGLLTALTAAQARAEAVEWISVDERLPEFGEHVLCCYPTLGAKGGQPIQAVLFLDEEFGEWFFGCDDDMEGSFMPYEPSHWRPLPPSPATDSAIGGKGA